MNYKVQELSNLTGITPRMLHHYHKIELLTPDKITDSGYRLYSSKNLERLQDILFLKELDFSLREIKIILDNPSYNRTEAFKTHKKILLEKRKRLDLIIETLDSTIKNIKGGKTMSNKEMFKGFSNEEIENQKSKYAEEVKSRYGDTSAYKEYTKKSATYSKDDWNRIQSRFDSLFENLASLMDESPRSEEVQKYIEKYREHISLNFYECTPEIFRGLGSMYVCDPRFTKNIDKHREGLSKFLKEAIDYYCDKL